MACATVAEAYADFVKQSTKPCHPHRIGATTCGSPSPAAPASLAAPSSRGCAQRDTTSSPLSAATSPTPPRYGTRWPAGSAPARSRAWTRSCTSPAHRFDGGRWSASRKAELIRSRVDSTRLLVDHLAALDASPATFVSASAVGYYGDRGDEAIDETSSAGDGFLAELCSGWEAEARRAEEAGMRTVLLRSGILLSQQGGALARMLMPFKLGLGGPIGGGRQWLPWIARNDAAGAVEFALTHEALTGPVNLVAPGVRHQSRLREGAGSCAEPAGVRTAARLRRAAPVRRDGRADVALGSAGRAERAHRGRLRVRSRRGPRAPSPKRWPTTWRPPPS